MTFQQAISELANGNKSDEAIKVVYQAVAAASQRGQGHDGFGRPNILDWVAEGDHSGNETVETLAARREHTPPH